LSNVKQHVIKINDEIAMHHLNLNSYKNNRRLGFSPEAQQHFNIEPEHEAVDMIDGSTLGLDEGLDD
jgi:hypothetical protein